MILDIYYAIIPETEDISSVFPKEREEEILSCSNNKVRLEKYFVWKLLEYGMKNSLGLEFEKQNFRKLECGKWVCDSCCFSLSHSEGLVAVAVSLKPVGIDIEYIKDSDFKAAKRAFSDSELEEFEKLDTTEKTDFFFKKWTQKESTFKKGEAKVFSPSSIEKFEGESRVIEAGRRKYYLSAACGNTSALRIFGNPKI